MASKLHNATRTYGRSRVIELSEAYSTSPTRFGTASNGTWTDNSANSAVAGYISTDGPVGGAGCWEFETTTSTTTQEYFRVTSSPESNEAAEFADDNWAVGFWFKIIGSIPDTTSTNAIRLFTALPSSSTGFTVQVRGQQATTNASQLSIGSSATQYNGSAITTDTWHYFAIRKTGLTGTNMYAYLDGTQFASWSNTTASGTLSEFGFNQSGANTANATWRVSNFHVGSSSDITAEAIASIWNIGNTTPSGLEKKIGEYAVERSIEMSDTPDATPEITGSNAYGTYTKSNTVDLVTTDGPVGGLDCWAFTVTSNASTTGRFALSSTNDYLSTDDEDYTVGAWFNFPSLPAGSNVNAHRLIAAGSTSTNGFELSLAGSSTTDGTTVGSRFYLETGAGKIGYSSVISANTWYYVAVRRAGSGTNNMYLYVNGSQVANFTNTTTGTASSISIGGTSNPGTSGLFRMSNFHIGTSSVLDASAISDIYTAGSTSGSTNVSYSAAAMSISNSEFPMPIHTAETVINVTYTSDVLGTASADIVDSVIGIGTTLDGGGVSTASALAVDPTITTTSNIDYAADPATASATSPNANVAAQRFINYSADPATASALFSSNVFYGQTLQDTSYTVLIREVDILGGNRDGSNGFEIGTQTDNYGTTISNRQVALLKPNSGFPVYNKVVKVKIDNTHVTVGGGDNAPQNTFNIYVLTGNPTSGTFTTAGYDAFTTNREYLYTTRLGDDAVVNWRMDLTQAFADSRAHDYGIMIEHVVTTTNTIGTIWDRTEFSGSGLDNGKLLYILTSDIVSKNINADIITASALSVDPTVEAQKYVNFIDGVATASADIVDPVVSIQIAAEITASPLLTSALSVQPTFSSTVEYPHAHAEAFGTIVTPQVFAFGTITYAAAPSTASALFHDPQTQIGEINTVASMDGSALFVDPMLLLSRSVAAMVTTASTLMVDPAVNTQLLGRAIAEPMTATAISPNPPAYLDLFSDPWYSTLYAQHSVRHGLPAGYGRAFLKIFEDQNTDITQSTPNTVQSQNVFNGIPTLRDLRNNITYGMYVNSGPENDFRYVAAPATTDYSTASNESRMSVGYFDNWNRKAVRLQNIGFRAKDDLGYSKSDFSMEFSIKTTKANQIISYGAWSSQTGPSNVKTTFNLVDGKLNYMTYGLFNILHPYSVKPVSEASWNQALRSQLTGNTRIDDGQWHHIVIQFVEGPEMDGGIVGRVQFWIDGNLDIQRFNQFVYDPDFMGANIEDATFAPDFYTSAWSIDAPGTVAERDIDLHYYDFIKYEPILAEPMTASLTMTSGNTGKGNRGRALMLYWWPTTSGQNQNQITRRFDSTQSGNGEFDINMSPQELETIDYISYPPQQYYGWDVFPVDINGYYVSDLVKEQAYGGAENIVETTLGGAILTNAAAPKFKVNRRGYFRNTLDDTRRYIDLVNDIDLSQFDAIFFKNYPDQSNEVDSFARNEIVDPYFNLRETAIYENFIKSLRAAVDTGISLMVNNPQLALDLKIIDRIEVVPDLTDGTGYYSDPYSPSLLPDSAQLPVGTGSTTNIWTDTYRNNRIRILNTLPRLTDYRSIIYTDAAYWNNDDTLNYGGANRPFRGYQYKSNGLSVGDEFFISTFNYGNVPNGGGSVPRNYLATPLSNIKAGTPITAFANQYRQGLNLVNNPYKDYVTSIAVKPGDVVDGKQIGGKIWVNFTDAFNDENEYVTIDAIHTEWINYAYNEGNITLAQRNALLASPYLLETRLSNGEITQSEYDKLARWESNGMYILTQTQQINEEIQSKPGEGGAEKVLTRKFSKDGIPSTQVSYITGPQFFTFTYARQFEQLTFAADSMNTRGLRWLSSRVATIGQDQTHTAMPASATMIQPIVIGEKQVTVNAQAMLATATKMPAVGYEGNDRNIVSLPLEASARAVEPVKRVSAEPMTASAAFREQLVIRTTAQDQVVVYVLHEDPILYLREDIIK